MIEIIRSSEAGLERIEEPSSGCWINVVDPSTEEISRLTGRGVPLDFVLYSLDVDERSRIERDDDGVLLVLIRIPYSVVADGDVPYQTVPLGLILCDGFIVTVTRRQNEVIQEFTAGGPRGFSTAKRNRFILHVLLITASRYLAYLREINKATESLEDRLQASMRNRELYELLKYQKSLVYFATALKSNELAMERLQRIQLFHAYPDDEDLLEDVLIENQQAIEMTNISSGILSSMMDAFASIISNNLNVVMKFLASITIVMSIPTIVTSFFGMNVNLPFQNLPYAHLLVVAIFVGISAIVVYVFMKRDWF